MMTGGDEGWMSPHPSESIDEGKKVKLLELIHFPLTFNPEDASACMLHGAVEGEPICDDRIPKFSDIHAKFKPMRLNITDYGYDVFQLPIHFIWIQKLIESIIPQNESGYCLSEHSIKTRSNASSIVIPSESVSEIGPRLKSSESKSRSTLALPEAIKSIQSLFSHLSPENSSSQISWSAVGIPLEPDKEQTSNETIPKATTNTESSCQTFDPEQRSTSNTEIIHLEPPLTSCIVDPKQDNVIERHCSCAMPDTKILRGPNEHRSKTNMATIGGHGKTSVRRWLDQALQCCHRLKQL